MRQRLNDPSKPAVQRSNYPMNDQHGGYRASQTLASCSVTLGIGIAEGINKSIFEAIRQADGYYFGVMAGTGLEPVDFPRSGFSPHGEIDRYSPVLRKEPVSLPWCCRGGSMSSRTLRRAGQRARCPHACRVHNHRSPRRQSSARCRHLTVKTPIAVLPMTVTRRS